MSLSDKFDFDAAVLSQMENIRQVARRCLHNQNEIDDLVQETVLKAYAGRDSLRDEKKFNRWIAGIAYKTALDWNRNALYQNEREAPMDELIELPDFRTLRFTSLHDALEEAEEREQLHTAMGRLNSEDREMLRARYFDEASYGELQQKYGLSYSAVGFRLHRAKARLKKILTSTAAMLIVLFAGMKRAAWGGTLLMAKTTKIAAAASAAAAAGILIGGYIWLNNAGAESESAVRAWTVEEQSPRVRPLSAVKSTGAKSAPDSLTVQPETVQIDNEAPAAPISNADHETTAMASVEAETQEDAEEAEKQAAIDSFNTFQDAMTAFDFEAALSMARGEAHETLSLFAQLLDQADNFTVIPPEKPPVNQFIYADGELRVVSDGGLGLPTILRKTDGQWYVESMPAGISTSKTIKDEYGNVLDHFDTGTLPLSAESLDLIEEIAVENADPVSK